MQIQDHTWESVDPDCYGGYASVSRCTYKGQQVAVKFPQVYLTNFDSILSVSVHSVRPYFVSVESRQRLMRLDPQDERKDYIST